MTRWMRIPCPGHTADARHCPTTLAVVQVAKGETTTYHETIDDPMIQTCNIGRHLFEVDIDEDEHGPPLPWPDPIVIQKAGQALHDQIDQLNTIDTGQSP